MDKDLNQELDELVNELSKNPISGNNNTQHNQLSLPSQTKKLKSDEILADFVDENLQKTNDLTLNVLLQIANQLHGDPDRIEAFANLLDKHSNILKLLNDRIIKNKDNKTKILIQQMKNESDKIKDEIEKGGTITSGREDLFNALNQMKTEIIDAEFEEINENDDS